MTLRRVLMWSVVAWGIGGPAGEADRRRLVVLRQGKPVPGGSLAAVDADLNESKIDAGPDGVATWTPPGPGSYSIYTRDTTRRAGEAGGKSYEEVREFATLAF